MIFFLLFIGFYLFQEYCGITQTKSLYKAYGEDKIGYNYYLIKEGNLEPVSCGTNFQVVDTMRQNYINTKQSFLYMPYCKDCGLMIAVNNEIFIEGYVGLDSSIVKYVIFDTTCWGHISGYLIRDFLHTEMPNDTLIANYEKIIDKSTRKLTGQNVYNSPFGIQCN